MLACVILFNIWVNATPGGGVTGGGGGGGGGKEQDILLNGFLRSETFSSLLSLCEANWT